MRALALAAAVAASWTSIALADEAQTVNVSLQAWDLGFQEVTVSGSAARFVITNDGNITHAFELEGEIEGKEFEVVSPMLAPGERAEFTVELPAGTYEVYCPVADHEDRGMAGTVTFTGEH